MKDLGTKEVILTAIVGLTILIGMGLHYHHYSVAAPGCHNKVITTNDSAPVICDVDSNLSYQGWSGVSPPTVTVLCSCK